MLRLDSHQHFWRYNPVEHNWMTDAMSAIRRDFLPDELAPLLSANSFDGSIAVQARQNLEETRWLLELSDAHPTIRGVVGWVDLRSDDLANQLAAFSQHPRLVGVRHVVHDELDDNFMLRPEFRRGIAQLREFGLTYDLLLFPKHLPMAARLVAEFPGQSFVLDHIAKPLIADRVISPWREDLQALADFPNVTCKISGMVTEARWQQWQPEDFHPYLDAVFAAFGPERLMVGSDWPVCTLSAGYASTMAIVTNYVQQFAESTQAAILGGNCARIYGIQQP
jgi:L-fuconolactonase